MSFAQSKLFIISFMTIELYVFIIFFIALFTQHEYKLWLRLNDYYCSFIHYEHAIPYKLFEYLLCQLHFFPCDCTRRCSTSCQHCNETTGDRLTTAAIRSGFYRNFGEYVRPLRSERRLRKGIVFRPKAINDIWVQQAVTDGRILAPEV